jgi:hypothetical protein
MRALPVAVLLGLLACTPMRLASEYDEHIDRAATALQQEMDAHLTRLEALAGETGAEVGAHESFYLEYGVALRSLRIRAQGHRKNEITLQHLDRLEDSLEALRDQHRRSGTLPAGYAATARELFNSAWAAVIAWEIAKKRGG